MMRKIFFPVLFLLVASVASAQATDRMSVQEYIEKYKDDAVRDMKKNGVPASITLAQALFESERGNSPLAREANNHFGIKCHDDWSGATYYQDDDVENECFRKYTTVLESYDDHSDFLRKKDRYAFLFQLDITDYKGWAKGLKKAGYATNPVYAEQLIKIIEENKLYELDNGGTLATAPPEKKDPAEKKNIVSIPVTKTYNSPSASHKVLLNNDVKYVIAKPGDSYVKIASEFEMGLWQIFKYNEIERNTPLKEGQIIFIKPKRRNAEQEFYTVKEGDTMHSISQKFAMKSRLLYKKNRMEKDAEPKAGQVLWLKKTKPAAD